MTGKMPVPPKMLVATKSSPFSRLLFENPYKSTIYLFLGSLPVQIKKSVEYDA